MISRPSADEGCDWCFFPSVYRPPAMHYICGTQSPAVIVAAFCSVLLHSAGASSAASPLVMLVHCVLSSSDWLVLKAYEKPRAIRMPSPRTLFLPRSWYWRGVGWYSTLPCRFLVNVLMCLWVLFSFSFSVLGHNDCDGGDDDVDVTSFVIILLSSSCASPPLELLRWPACIEAHDRVWMGRHASKRRTQHVNCANI